MLIQLLEGFDPEVGPVYNNSSIIIYFIIFFILIGHYFLINLYTGAIFLNFIKAHYIEKSKISSKMND